MNNTLAFADLLKTTFMNQNNEVRRQNEIQITSFIQNSPEEYCTVTAEILRSPNLDPNSRMFAITTFNQAFRLKRNDPFHPIWVSLSRGVREALKIAMFNLLVDDQAPLRKPGANALGLIFILDRTSPKPDFPDIMNSICSNVNNANMDFAGIAVLALAAIFEYMTPARFAMLDQQEKDVLLAGVCNAMKDKNDNAQVIVQAASNAMPLMASRFDNEAFLQFVLEQLLAFIEYGIKIQSVELVHDSVNCISQVVKHAYPKMKPYMQVIIDKMLELDKFPEATIRKAVCEFYLKCFKYENQKREGFFDEKFQALLNNLLPNLFQCITLDPTQSDDVLEKLENYSRILNAINLLYWEHTLSILGGVVVENLKSADEVYKIGGIMILESMVDIRKDNQAESSFRDIFKEVFELIQTSKSVVLKIVALNCVEKIMAAFISIPYQVISLPEVLNGLLGVVSMHDQSETGLQIRLLALNAIDTIAIKSKDIRQYCQTFQSQVIIVMDTLFKTFDEVLNTTLIDSVFATMFSLIENVMDIKLLNYYLPQMLNTFERVFTMPVSPNRTLFLESIVITLNLILAKLAMNGEVHFRDSPDRRGELEKLLKFSANVHESMGCTSMELVTLMTTVISSNKDVFQPAVPEFFERYLKPVLNFNGNEEEVRNVILAFVNLVKVYPQELSLPTQEFIKFIFMTLQTDLPREFKIPIYYFLSDIMINQPEIARQSAQEIINMNIQAIQAIVHILQNEMWDDEMVKFCIMLREVVMENLFCYIHGVMPMNDNNTILVLENAFPTIQGAFKIMIRPEYMPSPLFFKEVTTFLLDCLVRLKNRNLIDVHLITECFRGVSREDEEYRDLTQRMDQSRIPR